MPPVLKPPKSTPAQRKAERQSREPNPYKPTYPKRKRIGEQETHVKARPQDHPDYRVNGSTIRTISKKKLAELEAGGKRISSTFRQKPGTKRLERVRKVGDKTVKSLQQRAGFNINRTPIKKVGRRIKRLQLGDRKAAAAIKGLPCLCGCCLPVQWAHLETRAYESTRHDPIFSIPACEYLHPWLDDGKGRPCRTVLLRLAHEAGRRLTGEDVEKILIEHGYYGYVAERRAKER